MYRTVRRVLSAGAAAAAISASLVAFPAIAHAASPSSLASGGRLQAGQEIDDQQYRLVMQGDGNLVEYADGHALWSTGTDNNSGAYVVMQSAGNLVVYPKGGGKALWANSGTGVSGSVLQLNPDGNLVIYSGSTPEWSNGARETTVYSGQTLSPGQYVQSPSRTYNLVMQDDGNLVLRRNSDSSVPWSSGTQNHSGAYAVMQSAGNLVVYPAGGGSALWANSGSGTSGAVLQVTDSGTIQIVSGSTVTWSSSAPASAKGQGAVSFAAAHAGNAYGEPGTGPTTWDCSGLVQAAYASVGVSLPRVAADQWNATALVSTSKTDFTALHIGDLVFFNTTGDAHSHVGLYAGNGMFWAANTSSGVSESSLTNSYWNPRYEGARRVAGA